MTHVKNLAGLVIVLGAFGMMFIISGALFTLGFKTLVGGDLGLFILAISSIGTAGVAISGWVLLLFFKNFSWQELMAKDDVASNTDAPVAIEIKLDNARSRSFLIDSRNSPRATNPSKLGRGVFIVKKKRGVFVQDEEVVTLISSDGTMIKNVRDFDEKIHFDMTLNGENRTIQVMSITEQSINFDKKETILELENSGNTKAKLAERWADALK